MDDIRISHVLNPVGVPESHHLWMTQQVTFAGIERARAGHEDRVEVVTVSHEEDRPIVPPSFRPLPNIEYSILDVAELGKRRKLPFIADVLATAHRHTSAEHLIYTNADIVPGPRFYEFVQRRIDTGLDAFTINRRTVEPVEDPLADLDAVTAQHGKAHPGHDCFVFPRSWVPDLDLGRIVIGVPWIGFILLLNLAARGDVEVLDSEFQTFHVGDDLAWLGDEDAPSRSFNTSEAARVMGRLLRQNPALAKHPYIARHVAYVKSLMSERWFRRPPEILTEPPRKIFALSSGRAGSEYLQTVLGSADRVVAFHEPEPTMSGVPLVQAMERGLVDHQLVSSKLDRIDRLSASFPPGWTYVETNHMFVKTFADGAVARWPEHMAVVHLRRNLLDVIVSFMKLGYFSEVNKAWPAWMHRVPSALSIVDPPAPYDEMSPLDRTIAYLLDIEAQARAFRERHPTITVVETSLEDLQSRDEVGRVFELLGLRATPHTDAVVGRRVNDRSHVKAGFGIAVDREEYGRRLEDWLPIVTDPAARALLDRSLSTLTHI